MRDQIDTYDRFLANLIIQGRKSHSLTQEDLAEKIGVDHRTIQRWECGESTPQPYHINKLITILPERGEELRMAIKKIPQCVNKIYYASPL